MQFPFVSWYLQMKSSPDLAPRFTVLFTHSANSRPINTLTPVFHAHSHCLKCVKILLVSFPAFLEEEFPWETFDIPGNWRAASAAGARLPQCSPRSVVDQQQALSGRGAALEPLIAQPVETFC